ncbi:MAG: 3'(2'),5'-bisphosphate nucleotidase CysQ [Alphaproteobacteria bacterium]|nr:3'(2'),5'-bisphosphate nucleotidase CysQ [Alphaproteobacteria bacterium]
MNPDLDAVIAIARAAGDEILRHYGDDIASRRKSDGSPVTDADHAAEAVIVAGLQKLEPGVAIVSEEQAAAGHAPDVADAPFWCVDPLDGTKEFIARTGEFVVCIARIVRGAPMLGVVHAPVGAVSFAGTGGQAIKVLADGTRHAIRVRAVPAQGAVALDSRSHRDGAELDRWLAARGVTERRICGSALKFGLVAEGAADYYARFGPTSEWDTAAGHAVLVAAGGTVTQHDGSPLRYAKPRFLNPGFIARGAQ